MPDSTYNLKQDTESDETKEILKQGIAKLSQKQRLALKLSIYDYKKQKDIAGIMGLFPNTVASLIRRAKNQIHKEIKECYAH